MIKIHQISKINNKNNYSYIFGKNFGNLYFRNGNGYFCSYSSGNGYGYYINYLIESYKTS